MDGATNDPAAQEPALARALPDPEVLVPTEQLDRLGELSTQELREQRAACEAAEEGLSYARRLLQGRLDILRAGLVRHDDDAAPDLLGELPAILADPQQRSDDPLQARVSRVRVPKDAERYAQLLDDVLAEDEAERLEERSIDDLRRLVDRLSVHEQELSTRRRALFDRIDALRAELADRYRDGRADVRELLT